MGGEWSSLEREPSPDPWWANAQPGTSTNVLSTAGEDTENKEDERTCKKVKDEEMDAFKKEIIRKRELRHAAISSIQNEMKKLRSDLAEERTLRKAAEEERDNLIKVKSNDALLQQVEKLKQDLEEEISNKKAIEEERDRLKEKENELEAVEQQVRALKEVTTIGKEMLKIRELQVRELKKKLEEIEIILPNAPEGLRLEYEQQIQNIHKLRELYEQRALATRTQHQQERQRDEAKINMLEVKVNELQEEIQEYKDKTTGFEEKILHFEGDIEEKTNQIETLQDQLYSSNLECRSLKSQMKIINDLFSQVLAGPEFDLDRLTRLLKENHGLITDLTTMGDSNEVAALLIDIAEKADGETILGIKEKEEGDVSVCKEKEEIAANLSKVWRVLVELLSHHKEVSRNNAGSESCYKSVDTPSGPRLVISVSQTYLTLKDLILEKNSLVKEVGRLKTLNGHLETRMHSQERRLSIVSTELKKTWSVVSKLRAQHKQLHNHEKILRYELQHKRQMLTELKQELEHCREKWDRARQKNTQSEEDWKQLRNEFALRKSRKLSNSAESGYEEEDSHSSPTEELSEPLDGLRGTSIGTLKHHSSEISESDLSEEDVEHSDGNSYETVIDLLEIACLESQIESEPLTSGGEFIPVLGDTDDIPLNDIELSEGLSYIESNELAAEVDVFRTNIPTPDFSSPFPSNSSSPIPTETDDLTFSEIDSSEEIPRSVSPFYQLHYTEEPITVPEIPQENFLFGSNSAQNIARFLEGLIDTNTPSSNNPTNQDQTLSCDGNASDSSTIEKCDSVKTTPDLGVVSIQECSSPLNLVDTESVNSLKKSENEFQLPSTSQSVNKTSNILKFGIPTVLIEENEVTTQRNEIEVSSNVCSVFDEECVANAIQSCLQEMQNTCPLREQNDESEINNNVTESNINYNSVFGKNLVEVNTTLTQLSLDETISTEQNDSIENESQIIKLNQESLDSEVGTSTAMETKQQDNNENKLQTEGTKRKRTSQEILEARALRLKRLEEQCKSLFSKMSATSRRSDLISNKLEELHEQYGPSNYTKNTQDIPTISNSEGLGTKGPEVEKCNVHAKERLESQYDDEFQPKASCSTCSDVNDKYIDNDSKIDEKPDEEDRLQHTQVTTNSICDSSRGLADHNGSNDVTSIKESEEQNSIKKK